MANPAAMGATSPDGISYLLSGSPINPPSESAQQATTIQAAFSNRTLFTYSWANAAARIAQTGMRDGDMGQQVDIEQPYIYLGGQFGWCPTLIGHPSYGGGRMITSSISVTPTTAVTGGYVGSANITFPVGFFNSTPSVQTTAQTGFPNAVNTSYQNATAAGFTIYLSRDNQTPTNVSWTASQ